MRDPRAYYLTGLWKSSILCRFYAVSSKVPLENGHKNEVRLLNVAKIAQFEGSKATPRGICSGSTVPGTRLSRRHLLEKSRVLAGLMRGSLVTLRTIFKMFEEDFLYGGSRS